MAKKGLHSHPMDIERSGGSRCRRSRLAALVITLAAVGSAASAAAFPSYINYQGKLGDPSGNPLTGVYSFRFRFYDSPTKSTLLATEAGFTGAANAVNVTNGLYSVQIGSFTPLPETVFHQSEVWLEITVGQGTGNTGPEILDPPERLAATPFSFRAIAADKLGTGMTVATFTAAGNLTLPYGVTAATASFTNVSGFSLTASSGINVLSGGVYAPFFSGDGSGLTGVSAGESNTYTSSKTFTNPDFSIGGSTFVTRGGNVGIGMTPTQTLSVAGRIETRGGMLFNQGSAATDNLMYLLSSVPGAVNGSMGAFAGGIGSSASNDAPYFLLRGNTFSQFAGQRGNIFFAAGDPVAAGTTEGAIQFWTGNDLPRMTVNKDGRVGIGTTIPSTLLEVNSDAQFGLGAAKSTFTVAGNLQMVKGSTITSNGTISFSTAASAALASTPNLFIGANGNVGVGTATPATTLEVAGGLRINTTTAKPTCDTTQRGTAWLQQGAGGVADLMFFCMKTTADTYQWVQLGIGN